MARDGGRGARLMPVPPLIVRRLVLCPVVVAVEALVLAASPLVVLIAAVASPAFGGWRPLRAVVVVLALAGLHLRALVECAGLWAAAGLGTRLQTDAMQRAHYEVLRRFVRDAYRVIVRVARVEIAVTESAEAGAALTARERPALVLGRHAGEGDTLLVVYELACLHGREPRIVMHEKLRLDPLVDVLGARLPNRFVDPRGGDTEREIAAMAADLDASGALVIFPEGVNFSAAARERAIARLERAGHHEQAAVARRMRHLSAPRPGGALAAIEAAPEADVIFFGHAGFPDGLGEVWRHLPERQTVEVRLWRAEAATVPADEADRVRWLFEWWARLDDWVDARSGAT